METGDRVADWVSLKYGSWGFILGQNLFYAGWALVNAWVWILQWDPYPWMGMNLIMSWVAANSGSFIQQSQNRQAQRDRHHAEEDYRVNREAEERIEALQKDLARIEIGKLDVILGLLSGSPRP